MVRFSPGRLRLGAAALAGWVLLALPCYADTLRGTLRSVDSEHRRIVVVDRDGDDNHLAVARDARVSLNGKRVQLAELKAKDRVAVTFSEDSRGNATATAVEATRGE